ncbi:hypothetical protein [Xylanibacter muris]|uniref:hypothetical protein n=1 Tax=Xylanibacter muris TaxID=2736290 RepID=UPI000FFEA6DC|nr:hypothetical protein [Xylanibacter muris]RXE72225.1 hypothetical protein ED352_01865 [Muribaculaceae bacterium Isolate-002 (NCI)]
MAQEEQEGVYSKVNEPTVHFKLITDRIIREINNPEINQTLIRISGYDLQIDYNLQYLKSVEDIEAACNGIAQLFREDIMRVLLERNKQSE